MKRWTKAAAILLTIGMTLNICACGTKSDKAGGESSGVQNIQQDTSKSTEEYDRSAFHETKEAVRTDKVDGTEETPSAG